MPFVNVRDLRVFERLPGWHGRYFHSQNMTFAHYDFVAGSSIHEHFHPEEEVYEVIEGELELAIDGDAHKVTAGAAAIVPPNARHSVKALTDGRVIIVDYPIRPEFGVEPLQDSVNA
ncbi:MAG TPA: cupin domain-containing protein [Terriglobales bacterium]|nr:cupin domain-containing protein [Terriglobales bacterium]